MSRKDYEAIAAALRPVTEVQGHADFDRADGAEQAVRALAEALATTNLRFDRDRFLKATGVTP